MVLCMTLSLFFLKLRFGFFTGVAMLDFDELQELPKMSSSATKSDFICGLMRTKNNNKKTCAFPDFRIVTLATVLSRSAGEIGFLTKLDPIWWPS